MVCFRSWGRLLFSFYLWGIETCPKCYYRHCVFSFHSTYEELKLSNHTFCRCATTVFILPMRNWNQIINSGCAVACDSFHSTYEELKREVYELDSLNKKRFHSTYEELKPCLVFTGRSASTSVFILPMRNWNHDAANPEMTSFECFHSTYEELKHSLYRSVAAKYKTFSFYLWGIETEQADWIARHSSTVFILPMRNWNIFSQPTNQTPP